MECLMDNQIRNIKMLILDVDGVMTDGGIYFTDQGDELKRFSSLDGHGITMLRKVGIKIAIITGRRSQLMEHRARNLKIDYLYQGVDDKLATFQELLQVSEMKPEECAYIGDDVIDLPVMRRVAFAVAVPNSPEIVRKNANYTAQKQGGAGAIREVCDMILQVQGHYDELMAYYLR
jgi:3-deoxy-D-manno-octulosonate 8-phosphate phosphatase (KDO 8-P phosphatase)